MGVTPPFAAVSSISLTLSLSLNIDRCAEKSEYYEHLMNQADDDPMSL